MSSIWQHPRGGWYVTYYPLAKTRIRFYLGKTTKAQASNFCRRIDLLHAGNQIGEPPTADVAAWLQLLPKPMLEKLAESGLTRNWSRPTASPRFVDYWQTYVATRTDFSRSTIKGFNTAYNHALAAFGDRTLDQITVADAKQFQRDLVKACATSHAKKILERTRTIFAAAIDSKLIDVNPFADSKIRVTIDKTRQSYIDEATAKTVLGQFTSAEGRALFALARWCGLRVPHEPLALDWKCVDWDLERLRIPNETKTGWRIVPLFPVALAELSALWATDPPGQFIFTRARSSAGTTWREWLETAISSAHVKQWPKLWVNLRASCRTDLEDKFPSHVCDAWLGHSTRVARDHYLQVTPEHWADAKATPKPDQTASEQT